MWRKAKRFLSILLMILLSGCITPPAEEAISDPVQQESVQQESVSGNTASDPKLEENYCRQAAQMFLLEHQLKGENESETVRRVYDFLIETISFAPPVGLDIWRYRSNQKTPPSYLESHSLSPLLFGVGSCEDFSAAMVILLEEAGIAARYVAGYTLSVNGHYTDHAWLVAQINGNWYHFDPQLEQNVTQGLLAYRFFMRTDTEMRADHLWGENLLEYVGEKATDAEKQGIRELFTPPLCDTPAQRPSSRFIEKPQRPNMKRLEKELSQERQSHAPLPSIELSIEPPVLVAAQPLTDSDPR